MSDLKKILILGGTKEASDLAAKLVAEGHDVTTSLAGATRSPEQVAGNVRIGGFSKDLKSGAIGLAEFLEEGIFDLMIDATHPFAKQISENAKLAASISGVELQIQTRLPWKQQAGDYWIIVDNLEEAASAVPIGAKIFLALGSKHIDIFNDCHHAHFLVRMVDEPSVELRLPKHTLLLGKPGQSVEEEKQLLIDHEITHIICRNSGGDGAYAKIEAARELKLPVIIVSQS